MGFAPLRPGGPRSGGARQSTCWSPRGRRSARTSGVAQARTSTTRRTASSSTTSLTSCRPYPAGRRSTARPRPTRTVRRQWHPRALWRLGRRARRAASARRPRPRRWRPGARGSRSSSPGSTSRPQRRWSVPGGRRPAAATASSRSAVRGRAPRSPRARSPRAHRLSARVGRRHARCLRRQRPRERQGGRRSLLHVRDGSKRVAVGRRRRWWRRAPGAEDGLLRARGPRRARGGTGAIHPHFDLGG